MSDEVRAPATGSATTTLRILHLFTDRPFTHTGTHLRGTLIAQFPDRVRMHGHHPDGRPRASEVRYLVRDAQPHVVTIGGGRDDALDLYTGVTELTVPGGSYRVLAKELQELPVRITVGDCIEAYRFVTPWLALNQDNHQGWEGCRTLADRRALLERIAIGNLLTAARSAGAALPRGPIIRIRLLRFEDSPVRVGGQSLIGFRAELSANVAWSPWIGLGKMVAKGFGLLEPL